MARGRIIQNSMSEWKLTLLHMTVWSVIIDYEIGSPQSPAQSVNFIQYFGQSTVPQAHPKIILKMLVLDQQNLNLESCLHN